jgi:vacuolar-type H+-ATPase subunit H
MPETMQTTIANIEKDAEKILEEARTRARQVLENAKSEAGKILSSDLPMEEVTKEQNKIINTAEEGAAKQMEGSKKKASQIKARAETKIDETVKYIVDYIRSGQ